MGLVSSTNMGPNSQLELQLIVVIAKARIQFYAGHEAHSKDSLLAKMYHIWQSDSLSSTVQNFSTVRSRNVKSVYSI